MVSNHFFGIKPMTVALDDTFFLRILDEEALWGKIEDNFTGDGVLGAVVERRAEVGISGFMSW